MDITGPDLIGRAEAARLLGVAPETVTHWANSGKLSYVRLPSGHRRYRLEDVQELLSQRKARS